MAGMFDPPKMQTEPVPDPTQTANQLNDALTRRLQTGGTAADQLSPSAGLQGAAAPQGRQPTLTGLN